MVNIKIVERLVHIVDKKVENIQLIDKDMVVESKVIEKNNDNFIKDHVLVYEETHVFKSILSRGIYQHIINTIVITSYNS